MSAANSDVELIERFENAPRKGNPQEQDDMDERTNGNHETRILNDDPYFCPTPPLACAFTTPQEFLIIGACVVGINGVIYTYRKTHEYFQRKWK